MGSVAPQTGSFTRDKLSRIRRAEEKNIAEIANLGATTFADTFGYSMPAADLKTYLESTYCHSAVGKDLVDPRMDTFVAYDDSKPEHVMGFVQLTQGTSEPCLEGFEAPIELQRLYVRAKYHGKGIGGALTRHVEALAREKGFVTIWLGVWEENFNAQKAYEKLGFRKVGEHDFIMGDCVQTDWILTKPL